MGEPDSLSRHSQEEKSGMNAHIFNEWQLLDLKKNDIGEEEDAEDMELEGIDVVSWEMKNGL